MRPAAPVRDRSPWSDHRILRLRLPGVPEDAARAGGVASGYARGRRPSRRRGLAARRRSEEHTSELQSPCNLVCRLLLEKKKKDKSTMASMSCTSHHVA